MSVVLNTYCVQAVLKFSEIQYQIFFFILVGFHVFFQPLFICEGGVELAIDHHESGNQERVKVKRRERAVPPDPLYTRHSDKASLLKGQHT